LKGLPGLMLARVTLPIQKWLRPSFAARHARVFLLRCQRLARVHWHGSDAAAIGLVVFLHLIILWLILWSLRLQNGPLPPRELQVVFFEQSRAAKLQPPIIAVPEILQPPEFVIANDAPTTAPIGASAAMVLAPRPDPKHPNMPLDAGGPTLSKSALLVILKILVLADGSVGDAQIVASSGEPQNDSVAMAYVKANWRFLPALLNGTPIQYWTTVSVPFGVAGR
jgi:TonB family protein